jgi:hypothetical protein
VDWSPNKGLGWSLINYCLDATLGSRDNQMTRGFANDISLYYLVMGGGMVLDDLVHHYDTCLLRYIHASVYLNGRVLFLRWCSGN